MGSPLRGIAVSPGVAIATAHCLHDIPATRAAMPTDESQNLIELAVFETALQETATELQQLHSKVLSQTGEEEAAIFSAHLTIAQDASLSNKVRQLITDKQLSAAGALQLVLEEYEHLFSQVKDEYLKERLVDLRDVLHRLTKHACSAELDGDNSNYFTEPVVLVANELMPSDVVAVSESNVVGVVTQSGSRTSHAAILARSYGIPAVAGVAGVLSTVTTGDTLVLDGGLGEVFVNPPQDIITEYVRRRTEFAKLRKTLAAEAGQAATTKDGEPVELFANINSAVEVAEAHRAGASGIGLYRTEFFYLTHPHIPTEDEQVTEYRRVLQAWSRGPVTIRTLDLGGDKTIPFLTHAPEANPFLGWRSIRLSFEHPEIFLQQIRAVLRAAHGLDTPVHLLFPMITTGEELLQIHEFVNEARADLHAARVPFHPVKIGMMLEVPAAAVMIDRLLKHVDFVSIGSNDLVQYLTAADRDNPKVNHLCQALCPAVLRVLHNVISICCEANKPVTVCGEMAGSPRAFPLLLGMGLRSFSMSSSFIPAIRDLAAHVSVPAAETVLTEAMGLDTSKEIHKLMDNYVLHVCPELSPYLIA